MFTITHWLDNSISETVNTPAEIFGVLSRFGLKSTVTMSGAVFDEIVSLTSLDDFDPNATYLH